MQFSDRDIAYLVDMLACCNDILAFTAGITLEQFEKDRMRRLATERQLEILGEAANHVSQPVRDQLRQLPWANIIGLRNKLAHDYGEVIAERVWQIAAEHIAQLKEALLTIPQVRDADTTNR